MKCVGKKQYQRQTCILGKSECESERKCKCESNMHCICERTARSRPTGHQYHASIIIIIIIRTNNTIFRRERGVVEFWRE